MAPIAKSTLRLLLLVSIFSSSLANSSDPAAANHLESRNLNLAQHLDSMADGLQRRHHHSDLSSRMEKKRRGLVVGLVQDLGDALGGGGKSSASQPPTSTHSAGGSAPTNSGGSSNNGAGSSNGGSSGSSNNNNNHNNNSNNNNSNNNNNQDANSSGSSGSTTNQGSNHPDSGSDNSGSGSSSNVNHQANNNGGGSGGNGDANAGNVGATGGNTGSSGASSGSGFSASPNADSNNPVGSDHNRNLAAQKASNPSTTDTESNANANGAAGSSSSSISGAVAASAAASAVGSTSPSSAVANGASGKGPSSSGGKTNSGDASSNGTGESSAEGGKASKTSVAVPIAIVLAVLFAGGMIFWFIKKKHSKRALGVNPLTFQAAGPQTSPRPLSQESFVAGRPQSTASYLDRPMSEVGSIGVTSQGHGHGMEGFTIVAPAAVASNAENPFADNVQNGRPISPETDARTSHLWSATGHSHEAYLTASDESGGLYYDGSSRAGYSNPAARGLDEAGARNASGVQGAFSPYQDLQRGPSSNRDSNGSSSLASSENQTYEPYSDGPYADDDDASQNPFESESEFQHALNVNGNGNVYQGRNSSRWSG